MNECAVVHVAIRANLEILCNQPQVATGWLSLYAFISEKSDSLVVAFF